MPIAAAAQSAVAGDAAAGNAADEVAVAAFLNGRIGFNDIPRIIEAAVSASNSGRLQSIAQVLEADAESRRYAEQRILGISKRGAQPSATFAV